jgi:hypothetical protein
MLDIDSPTASVSVGPIFSASESLVSGVLSAWAVPSTIAEIDQVIAADSAEDRPSEETIRRVELLLKESHAHFPVYLAASEVESFEGALLIHWTTLNKRLTIISPRELDRPLKLYKRVASGWSQLTPNPSPVDLTAALQWVMQ